MAVIKRLKDDIRLFRRYRRVLKDIENKTARISYAEEGEDLFLQSYFANTRRGFYVDVGAHHPKAISNTYLLYKTGWSGINIDPIPGRMSLFEKVRPRDINLEMAIAENDGTQILSIFQFDNMATLDYDLAKQRQGDGWAVRSEVPVRTRPLRAVLDEFCTLPIDLLSVDAEGRDLEVLQSNDWERYRPRVICVEELQGDNDATGSWLICQGYRRIAITGRSRIYAAADEAWTVGATTGTSDAPRRDLLQARPVGAFLSSPPCRRQEG